MFTSRITKFNAGHGDVVATHSAEQLERLARIRRAYGVVPDGERVIVPLTLMDGSRSDDPRVVAYVEMKQRLADAWKQPDRVASPHPNLENLGEPDEDDDEHGDDVAEHRVAGSNRADADAAAQAQRDTANAEYVRRISAAWKEA